MEYLLLIYLMLPPETQDNTVLENKMTVNYELERMWKEAKWLSRLRRTTRFSVMTESNQTIISNEEFPNWSHNC